MTDIICVGNISIDLYFSGKNFTQSAGRFHLAIGGKYYSDLFHEDIGGGAVNVAAGLAKLGLKPAIFGKIGNNAYKELILKKLAVKKISSKFCQYDDNYYKMSAILLTDNGNRTIINYETPFHLLRKFYLFDELKTTKNIYFSPMPHLNMEDKIKMIQYLKDKQTLTFVNLSSIDCQKNIKELIPIFDGLDVLIINAHEFSLLIKKHYEEIDFKNLKIKIPYLKNRIVIITDGEKGSYGYFQNKFYYQEAFKPKKIIDTTGCGDAYTAGFIAQYIKTKNIPLSMQKASKYASKKLERLGAS